MDSKQVEENFVNSVLLQKELESDKAVKREALMAKLEPYEQALFRLLEHLAKIEQQAEGKPANEPVPQIKWNYGRTSQQLIDIALENQYLPLYFLDSSYEVVEWQYGINMDHPDYPNLIKGMLDKQKYDFLHENYRGTSDLRIILFQEGPVRNSLSFSANMGKLDRMKKDFEAAFDQEPYPVFCEDRHGFYYENPAYTATRLKQK
jgi:hypothetical protein